MHFKTEMSEHQKNSKTFCQHENKNITNINNILPYAIAPLEVFYTHSGCRCSTVVNNSPVRRWRYLLSISLNTTNHRKS